MNAVDWPMQTLGELVDGLSAGVSVRSDASSGNRPAVLKTSSVYSGRFDPKEAKSIIPVDIERARCSPKQDSLILSRMNTPSLVGAVGYVENDEPDLYLPDRLWLACARSPRSIDMRWLVYYLASDTGSRRIRELATGTSGSMKNIPKKSLLQLEITVPPLGLQRQISIALSDVDSLLSSLELLIAKKQAIKQGMMQQLLTGKTRLPGFAGDWSISRFADLTQPVKSRGRVDSAGPKQLVVELEDIGSGSGAISSRTVASASISDKTVFQEGDVLFGKLRAYLRKYWLATGPGFCSTEIWALRSLPQKSIGGFIRYVVESEGFIEVASSSHGTHMPRSDWGVVANFAIPIPTIDEQHAIFQVLSTADAEIQQLQRQLNLTNQVKQGMMQELLTGRTRLIPVGESA